MAQNKTSRSIVAKIIVLPLLPAADRPATKWPVELAVRALHSSNMFVERPPMTAIEPTRFATLGSHYRQQANACLRVANEALSPYDEEWRRLAAYWAKLARETETRWRATSDGRAAKLAPCTLALVHGPFFVGDGAAALQALADDYDRRLSDLAR